MTASGSNPQRILLVDDHEDTVTLQAILLRKDGYEVLTAEDAETALGLAAEHTLDLVVTDIRLPDRDGADLMRELHERYGLQGLALTGMPQEETASDRSGGGFIQVLLKPVAPEQLTEAVEAALKQAGRP